MDRCSSSGEISQIRGNQKRKRPEEKKARRERVSRKEIVACEKGRKVASTMSFKCFVAQEGRKLGSLKRCVRKHVAG